METVPNATDNTQPTDADIVESLARIDRAIAAVEANLAEHSSDLEMIRAARVRRNATDTISMLMAVGWLVGVVALAIYGTIVALAGVR